MNGVPAASAAAAQGSLAVPAADSKSAPRPPWWRRRFAADTWILLPTLLYFVVASAVLPDIANVENLANILSNALPLLAVAMGQTFVLVSGGIDLSVTSIIALGSVTGAWVMTRALPGLGAPGGLVAMVLVGAAVGLVNGLAVTRLRLPAFMVTLTVMMFGSGLAIYATQSNPIFDLPASFTEIGGGHVGPLPASLFLVGAVAVVAQLALSRTLFGRWLFAVGENARAARVAGVPVARVTVIAYVVCGVAAALASILYTGRLETGSPVMGQRIFLDVIGATVIGGTSLFGGRGSIVGTACGVLFITLVDNSLNMLGFSSFSVLIAKGLVILLAAGLDVVRMRALRGGRP